ncbi:hypothetical protein FA95DRAFT_1677212 [Auriscalpium vulgare]|uniref:Uncharacterized protein n=1 Tax=Auriscalpium vulgare TaxID=40419 RepID=A0ACB8S1L5_9AGAM|nr:hypothetical protein FA95DRAFT_1677212 [Auriscalpium vulgare]
MHRCLQILEIVYQVVQHLASEDGHASSLAHLALTRKIFLEPALDALWCNLDDLGPLVNCFPGDVLAVWGRPNHHSSDEESIDEVNERTDHLLDFLVLLRPLHASDWARFDLYARRVRSFQWAFHRGGQIYDALHRDRTSRSILPNITHLTGTVRKPKEIGSMVPFVGPKLRSLTFIIANLQNYDFGPDERAWLATTLGELKFSCPLLDEVTFQDFEGGKSRYDGCYYEGISQFICALPPIRSFTTRFNITQRAFTALAMMPRLEELQARIGEDGLPPLELFTHLLVSDQGSAVDVLFPALQSVMLFCAGDVPMQELAGLLLTMGKPHPIAHFKVKGKCEGILAHSVHLLDALSRAARMETMHAVDLLIMRRKKEQLHHVHEHPVGPTSMAELIQPLYVFQNLQFLRITAPIHCATFDDALVMRIARAFPLLERLELWGVFWAESRITFAAHKILATMCPSLRQISLPISTKAEVPASTSSVNADVAKEPEVWVSMNFTHWPLGELQDLRAYLEATFPNRVRLGQQRSGEGC